MHFHYALLTFAVACFSVVNSTPVTADDLPSSLEDLSLSEAETSAIVPSQPEKTIYDWIKGHDYHEGDDLDENADAFIRQYNLTEEEVYQLTQWKSDADHKLLGQAFFRGVSKIPAYVGPSVRYVELEKHPKVVKMLDEAIENKRIVTVSQLGPESTKKAGDCGISATPIGAIVEGKTGMLTFNHMTTKFHIESKTGMFFFFYIGRWITSADKSFSSKLPEVVFLESLSYGFKVVRKEETTRAEMDGYDKKTLMRNLLYVSSQLTYNGWEMEKAAIEILEIEKETLLQLITTVYTTYFMEEL
jgi:hypothetical protein